MLVDVTEGEAEPLPLAAMDQAGGAFGWLVDGPDFSSDADLVEPSPRQSR